MIEITTIDDVQIISFDGTDKLNVVVNQDVKLALARLNFESNAKYLLDLSSINYIDSTGFGILLSILRSCKNNMASFKICNANSKVMDLIKLLQLQNIFEIHNTRQDALNAYK